MTFSRAAAVFAAAAAAAAAASAETGGAAAGGEEGRIPEDFGRYEVILDKSPFGAPPPSSGADSASGVPGGGAGAAPGAADSAAPPEEAPLKMSSVSRFGGVPAAGFVDGETGVPFILRPGEGYAGYRLVDLDPDIGAAVVARGTNEWLVSLSWAQGQPTNIVPSARDPYFTAFRPESSAGASSSSASAASAAPPAPGGPPPPPGFAEPAARRPADTSEISPEEEAELVAQATVADPDGSSHVSFRELNRLRVQLRRRKVEEARRREIAAAEEDRRRREVEKAADEALLAAKERDEEEKARRQRAAVIAAIAQGYDVGEDVELTDAEAEELREAGFQVPGK